MDSQQMQSYSPTSIMESLTRTVQTSQHADDHIAALNSFLGMTGSPQQPQQPQQQQPQQQRPAMAAVSDQAMAAFLASTTGAYADMAGLGVAASQNSPLVVNTIGITPSQSMQSLQLNDFGADVASLAAAGFAVSQQPSNNLLSSTVDMSSSLYNNASLNSMDSSSLSSMLSAPAQQTSLAAVASPYNSTQIPSNSADFLSPSGTGYEQMMAQNNLEIMLGKRKYDEADLNFMPSSMGVPLSKRVSMPVTYGDYQGRVISGSSMPVPTGINLQRISSYHPGAFVANSPAQSTIEPTASGNSLPIVPSRNPISRLKTMPVTSANSSKNNANTSRRVTGGTSTFSTQPQVQPTQHQRKVAHNAIERRYRNNINDRITDLRNSVPALQNIRPKKKTSSSYARDSAETSNDDEDDDDEDDDTESSNQVDGVEAATKLNKATILGKSTEYIYYLRRTNDQLKRESAYLQEVISKLPDGKKILENVLLRAKQESALATVALRVPERATVPKKKQQQQ
ncbi:hypothetical protein GGI07_001173 [Coemansia sp. Benny D115]|nr:hypothetical protein GGI07_001173 [Coemansia sp. Benny D115]